MLHDDLQRMEGLLMVKYQRLEYVKKRNDDEMLSTIQKNEPYRIFESEESS